MAIMRGVVFLGDRNLTLQEFADPAPGEGEVILAIRASGMCGSDLRHYRAPSSAAESRSLVIAATSRAEWWRRLAAVCRRTSRASARES
jgi:NADPH:quinone reductase-like Zn-dependent oxidoreductase